MTRPPNIPVAKVTGKLESQRVKRIGIRPVHSQLSIFPVRGSVPRQLGRKPKTGRDFYFYEDKRNNPWRWSAKRIKNTRQDDVRDRLDEGTRIYPRLPYPRKRFVSCMGDGRYGTFKGKRSKIGKFQDWRFRADRENRKQPRKERHSGFDLLEIWNGRSNDISECQAKINFSR